MKNFLNVCLVFLFVCLAAQASANPNKYKHKLSKKNEVVQQTESVDNNEQVDKFEKYNRAMFSFNDKVDRWLLKPIAKGYVKVVPKFGRKGVSNFFNNLGEVTTVVNDLLQGKWKAAGKDTSRFLINTTIGIGGLFDVATKLNIEESDGEDFVQTLAKWGVPQGSYIVLPFLGPSSGRGIFGRVGDWYADPVTYVEDYEARWGLAAVDLVDTRANLLKLEQVARSGGDYYLFVRDAYLQHRDYLVNDGDVADDFGSDMDDFDEGDDDW